MTESARCPTCGRDGDDLVAAIVLLRNENAALAQRAAELFARYAAHDDDCPGRIHSDPYSRHCICGLAAARKELFGPAPPRAAESEG